MDIERDNESLLHSFCTVLLFIALCAAGAVIAVEGLDRSAVIAQKEAKARQQGRLEMLREVGEAFEREGADLETYYRWASRKGTTGFDGVVLAEGRQ